VGAAIALTFGCLKALGMWVVKLGSIFFAAFHPLEGSCSEVTPGDKQSRLLEHHSDGGTRTI